MMDFNHGRYAFVMPHFTGIDDESSFRFLDEAIESLHKQTDPNWVLIIVDDSSPSSSARQNLKRIQRLNSEKVHVIFNEVNKGPGHCRNLGINLACQLECPVVLFIDSDDIALPSRLETVRSIFFENPSTSVVYSTFNVIDEYSQQVPFDKLSPSIQEILLSHKKSPPQGHNAWLDMGIRTGYTNLTSATAVSSAIAQKFPFPIERVSEDYHTWLRYSAGGNDFAYAPFALTNYRIPQKSSGSSARAREGRENFYRSKARVDCLGFEESIKLAVQNRKIKLSEVNAILIKFYLKLADTLYQESCVGLAKEHYEKAVNISPEMAGKYIQDGYLMSANWLESLEAVSEFH